MNADQTPFKVGLSVHLIGQGIFTLTGIRTSGFCLHYHERTILMHGRMGQTYTGCMDKVGEVRIGARIIGQTEAFGAVGITIAPVQG